MAERSTVHPSDSEESVDISSDVLGDPVTRDEDSDNVPSFRKQHPDMQDAGRCESPRSQFASLTKEYQDQNLRNIKQSFYEFTRTTESGLIEPDIEKLERKFWSLDLDETTEKEPSQIEKDVQSLREKVIKLSETKKDEISARQTEPDESSSTEEQRTEELTAFKYDQDKDKLLCRKPSLREKCKEFLHRKYGQVDFTEDLESCINGLINHAESILNPPVNILRRIAYAKLCDKHFLSEFPSGVFAEPVENISISVDHFEILYKELPIKHLEQHESKDFDSYIFDLEKNPEINNIVPSFVKFDKKYEFPEKCLALILAILKNPYRKLEFFCDDGLSVVQEQIDIAEYLISLYRSYLVHSEILDEKVYEKLAEAIIRFANIHQFFLAHIKLGFSILLTDGTKQKAYQSYCKVLNLMISIGATIINLCLPQHFEKISCLAANYKNCDLYFHLLRACEISITNTIEHELWLKAGSSDETDLVSFYTACYNYFGSDLTTRLIPVFKKYEKRKDREEQYLSKKHSIFPTKYGYMNTEMRFLANMNKKILVSKPLNTPSINECNKFDSSGKTLFHSSNNQLGYVIQKDMNKLPIEDEKYMDCIKKIPMSYLKGVTDRLTKNKSLLMTNTRFL